MILYMYIAPGQGQTTLWGQNFDLNRNSLSLCPFVASFKQISFNSDFIHILNVFPHVYSPGARTDNPLKSDFLPFFYVCFFHMYIAPGRGRQPIGDKNFMTIERPCLFAHILQVSK